MEMKLSEDVSETRKKLCSQCSVVPFNDKVLGSWLASQDPDWTPCSDLAATYPYHSLDYKARDFENTKSILGLPVLKKDYYIGRKYPLDYKVIDSLPGLPYLERRALRGCEFCSLLRLEIMRAEYNVTGSVEITLAYHLKPDQQSLFYGLAALLANVAQRPDASRIPPASAKPNVLAPINIFFTVESDDDVASWLKIPRLLKEDKLCLENIQFMKKALDDCVQSCHHYTATGFVPSRLLDLGPQMGLDSIHLIDSGEIDPHNGSYAPRYAALSYCWGSPLATDSVTYLRTTIQSLESMKRHVHEQTIPLTILDAIKVCKALSIRYLWVDSLCIIQDEKSDWERESASMTLIYKNAFVTICTPSSKTTNDGFLVRHRKRVKVPFRSRVARQRWEPSIVGHYNLVASGTHRNEDFSWPELDVNDTSWSKRGWTLQEFQMSNRVLIFGESMIHFLCRRDVQSENGYRGRYSLSRIIDTLDTYESDAYPKVYYREWDSMLEDYGHRLFTDIEDKLPAISGMAKYIADETGDEYLAGLWKSQLPSSLLWYVGSTQNDKYHIQLPDLLSILYSPKPYIAPSWSPIRLDAEIKQGCKTSIYFRQHTDESTVVDASVMSTGENPFGRVQGGRIRIRGRLAMVSSDLTRLPCYSDADLWYTLDKGVITYYNLDCVSKENSCNRGNLSRLLIESEPYEASLHKRSHDNSDEAARYCLTNHLSLHAAAHGNVPDVASADWRAKLNNTATKLKARVADRVEAVRQWHDVWHIDNRDAIGLLIHPVPGTDDYVRVGMWRSMVNDGGGTRLFDNVDEREINIV